MNELKMIEKLQKNMERLCEAVTRFSAEVGLSSDALRSTLQQRLREFQTFEHHRQMYVKICDWIPSPECVQGENLLMNTIYLTNLLYTFLSNNDHMEITLSIICIRGQSVLTHRRRV